MQKNMEKKISNYDRSDAEDFGEKRENIIHLVIGRNYKMATGRCPSSQRLR
jgi:hypothetical protein